MRLPTLNRGAGMLNNAAICNPSPAKGTTSTPFKKSRTLQSLVPPVTVLPLAMTTQ
ncbi:MAG: hypothetical protein DDT34_01399 [Firmicutes bacterium]|nr:hypothetical protein [Bacillota bacterium]